MRRSEALPDPALVAAIANGDGDAFAVLYRRYLPGVVAYLLRQTSDREVAADLAAEVFAAVLIGSRRYRPDDTPSAWPWVLGIARNKLAESRRRGRVEARARRKLGFEREAIDDEDLARVNALAAAGETELVAMVDDLPVRQRTAIRARVIEDRSYEDIARELRCSEMVVRQGVSRGLARLRQRLTEERG